MTDSEQEILMMISSSGDSKAKAFEALHKVKDGDYDAARKLLLDAKKIDIEAHNAQTKMISDELSKSDNDKSSLSLLMVHAQDHYMSAQLARDLIEELVKIFEVIDTRPRKEA